MGVGAPEFFVVLRSLLCKAHKCQLLKRMKPSKGRNKKTVVISVNIFFNSSLQKNSTVKF